MKKTRSVLAMLMCLAMLISLIAVTATADSATVTSEVDFRTLTPADAGDASKTAMESLGVEVSGNWWVQDCYHVFATPSGGYADASYIQTLEAGEGKVFASDITLDIGYWLPAMDDPGYVVVSVSTDGETWTEAIADRVGSGAEWETSAYHEYAGLSLTGTAGASVVYVQVLVNRHSGQTSGGVSYTKLSATVVSEDQISNTVDFRTLTPADGGDASKTAMESLGVEVSGNWWVQDCYHVFATPSGGYADASYIQTLEAGEGKVFASDITLDIGYWLPAMDDPGYVVVSVSTDGETWTEAIADRVGSGAEWETSAYHEYAGLSLTGTAGASVVYVQVLVNRHSGQTSGGVSYTKLSGLAEVDPEYDSSDDPTEEPTVEPTEEPTVEPTEEPTVAPTEAPAGTEKPAETVTVEVSVSNGVDITTTDKIAAGSGGTLAGEEAKAELESMGLIIPEGSGEWMLNDCYHVFATPKDGYSVCSFIQTLELKDGNVLSEDATLDLGYWLASVGDPSWFWVEVSTDGENWTEIYVDEEGAGEEWMASAFIEKKGVALTGTAGASVVYVKLNVERHGGPTAGGITMVNINGVYETTVSANTPPAQTGDTAIGLIVALLSVCAAGIVLTSKKIKNI